MKYKQKIFFCCLNCEQKIPKRLNLYLQKKIVNEYVPFVPIEDKNINFFLQCFTTFIDDFYVFCNIQKKV